MPWPGLPESLTGRSRRHVESPVARPLRYIMSHSLNSDRPAVTTLGHKLDRDQFDKRMSEFNILEGMSLEHIFEVMMTFCD